MLACLSLDQTREISQHPTAFWDKELLAWVKNLAENMVDDKSVEADQKLQRNAASSSSVPNAEPVTSSQAGAKDPFAFDMSAFEMGPTETEPQHTPSADIPEKKPVSQDPFAFDMSAFNMSGGEPDSSAASNGTSTRDPYAFDPSAFGQETQPDQPAQPNASSDPYAFSMSAFDEGNEPGQEQSLDEKKTETASADPFAFDASAFGDVEAQPSTSESHDISAKAINGNPLDPYAFDASSFSGNSALGESRRAVKGAMNNRKVGLHKVQMPPKENFQPLTAAELRKIRVLCTPAQQEDDSESGDSSDDITPRSAAVAHVNDLESLQGVEILAQAMSEGGPERIASAVALDSAGVHAAAHIQVDSACCVSFVYFIPWTWQSVVNLTVSISRSISVAAGEGNCLELDIIAHFHTIANLLGRAYVHGQIC